MANKEFSDFIVKDAEIRCGDIIQIVNWYLQAEDGSKLSKTSEKVLRKWYEENPTLMGVIVSAYREKGYTEW